MPFGEGRASTSTAQPVELMVGTRMNYCPFAMDDRKRVLLLAPWGHRLPMAIPVLGPPSDVG